MDQDDIVTLASQMVDAADAGMWELIESALLMSDVVTLRFITIAVLRLGVEALETGE